MLSPRFAVYISVPGAAVGCNPGMSACLTAEMLAGCNRAPDFEPLWEATAGDTACFVEVLRSCAAATPEGCGLSRHAAPPKRRHVVEVITRADQLRKTSSLQTRLRSYRARTALASYRWTSPLVLSLRGSCGASSELLISTDGHSWKPYGAAGGQTERGSWPSRMRKLFLFSNLHLPSSRSVTSASDTRYWFYVRCDLMASRLLFPTEPTGRVRSAVPLRITVFVVSRSYGLVIKEASKSRQEAGKSRRKRLAKGTDPG
jgi:hypothetical protein